jgi:1,4-dihydroxy-2-naphthoate octaprenyltransferase
MITAGILLPGMGYFVVVGGFDSHYLILTLPILFYGLAFIINVEIPDLESDKIGNKITFIVRYNRPLGFALIAFLLAISSIYFFIISYILKSPINLLIVTTISLLPLIIALYGAIKKPVDRKSATKYVTSNIGSYILFLLILDIYFIWLLL